MTIMNDAQMREGFVSASEGLLADIRKALKAMEKALHSDNDNSIKYAAAMVRLSHDYMLKTAPKAAMAACSEKYPY